MSTSRARFHLRRDHRASAGRAAAWSIAVLAVLGSSRARASEEDRVAWVSSVQGAAPAMMLGPRTGFVPAGAYGDTVDAWHDPRLVLCTARGCEIVTARRTVDHGEGIRGVELTTARPLTDAPDLALPARIREAFAAHPDFADYRHVYAEPYVPEDMMPNSLAPPEGLSAARRNKRERRRERRKARQTEVEWADPSRWHGEYGAMGGVTLGFPAEQPVIPSGFASMRAGFRYHRRMKSSNWGDVGLVLLSTFTIGNQVGADLRAHYLGALPQGQAWALTSHPIFTFAIPHDDRAVVAGRFVAPLGTVAVGVGGVGREVGFVLQFGFENSVLIKPRFGLDLRCNMTKLWVDAPLLFHCGLGGFFR